MRESLSFAVPTVAPAVTGAWAARRTPPSATQNMRRPHAPNANHPSNVDRDRAKELDRFRGGATKLGTTPDALETEYLAARQTNPKLTHGQFVAANMVAHNLSAKNPNITTQAILDGLKSGKSIGQTLQSLGLSEKEAKEAEASAKREAKQAEHEKDEAAKTGGQ